MSSKRGRKRNDNLPPNRARDVQRAFRARRAAHLQALEQRVAELEEENDYFRQALSLPSSTRPPLGRGPTGKDQPYHDADKTRQHTVSPSGGSSVGSPASCSSSPELRPALITSSISSRTMTMIEAGPSHWTDPNERQTALSHNQSDQGPTTGVGHTLPILAPMPFKASASPNYSDRIPPPLHSPSNVVYPPNTPTNYSPTSERSIESNFDAREPRVLRRTTRDGAQHDFYSLSQNYPSPDSNVHPDAMHTTGGNLYPQSFHDPTPLHREWNHLSSDRVHSLREPGFPESRRFSRPPDQNQPAHHPHGYSRPSEMMNMPPPPRSSQQYDGRVHHHLIG